MKDCDFGLLLVSPDFQASEFITTVELPHLLGSKPVIPVGLRPVHELYELAGHQVFYDSNHKTFRQRTSDNTQDAFALELFKKILARLIDRPEPPKPKFDHRHLREALGDFDEERFVHTQGVMTTMNKGLEGAPEIDPSQRKDAIDFLMEWLSDRKAQPYCALLGEYGMGKTTTCKFLAKHLLDLRDKGETVPLPIYLDLRHVAGYARREPVLDEILDRILKRSWKGGPASTRLSPQELIGLVENGALVIWDGLDEVLVHLDANMGQSFTRQLFRIILRSERMSPTGGRCSSVAGPITSVHCATSKPTSAARTATTSVRTTIAPPSSCCPSLPRRFASISRTRSRTRTRTG